MLVKQFKTPILLVAFNRPDVTKKIFNEIKKVKPLRLYLALDGARKGHPEDIIKIKNVLEIINQIDWDCDLKELIQDKNLGCKNAVSSAISWFFKHEEEGIILEDDCLPHPDFFNFCERMLDHHRNNVSIMAITGDNFQDGQIRGSGSYYFSKYNHVWGWATWRRAWKYYDISMSFWPVWKNSDDFNLLLSNNLEKKYWSAIFDKVFDNGIDTWDYQWTASVWFNNGLTVTPNVNLVSNIGFGLDATHTTDSTSPSSGKQTQSMTQIIHPDEVEVDITADDYVFMNALGGKNLHLKVRVIRKIKSSFRRIFGIL